jgi:hypothetical protein
MTTSDVEDLFSAGEPTTAAAPAVAARKVAETFPVPPTLPWAKLLARSDVAGDVVIFVSWLWSGEVAEMLSDPLLGRQLLYRDGSIRAIGSADGPHGRLIYLAPDLARQMHAKRPLIRTGVAGTHSARYRFATPGDQPPDDLELPPGCDED